MLERSRERAGRAGLDVTWLHATGAHAPVGGPFTTVLVSTGVMTPATLHHTDTARLLRRARDWLSPDGVLVLAYCRETEQNAPYREMYRALGLGRVPSNNRYFVGTDSLDVVRARFAADPSLDRETVSAWFRDRADLVRAQHRVIRAMEAALVEQGGSDSDNAGFVGAHLGYEKPYLSGEEEKTLLELARAEVRVTAMARFSDDETRALLANRLGAARRS
jgi:hypothetical protein